MASMQDSGSDKAVTVARPTVLRVGFGSVLSISAGFGYFDVDTPEQVVACLCLFQLYCRYIHMC